MFSESEKERMRPVYFATEWADNHFGEEEVEYCLNVLESYTGEFEPDREVFEALAYLEKRSYRKLGFQLYRKGLKGDPVARMEGYVKIRQHLGVADEINN